MGARRGCTDGGIVERKIEFAIYEQSAPPLRRREAHLCLPDARLREASSLSVSLSLSLSLSPPLLVFLRNLVKNETGVDSETKRGTQNGPAQKKKLRKAPANRNPNRYPISFQTILRLVDLVFGFHVNLYRQQCRWILLQYVHPTAVPSRAVTLNYTAVHKGAVRDGAVEGEVALSSRGCFDIAPKAHLSLSLSLRVSLLS